MIKNKKVMQYGILSLIFIILLVGSFFVVQQSAIGQTCTEAGASFMITDADIRVNDQTNEEYIRVVAISSGQGGECARIMFDKDELNDEIDDDDKIVTKEHILDIFPISNSVDFRTKSQSEGKVYTLRLETSPNVGRVGELICTLDDDCHGKGEGFNDAVATVAESPLDCQCVIPHEVGEIFEFSETKQFQTKTRFKLDSEVKDVSMREDGVVDMHSGDVRIKWVGNLVSGTDIDVPRYSFARDYRSVITIEKLVRQDAYSNVYLSYEEMVSDLEDKQQRKILFNALEMDEYLPELNTYGNVLKSQLADKTQEFIDSNDVVEDVDIIGGMIMHTTLKNSLQYPMFIIDLNAEYMGIQKVSGIPRITECVDDFEIDSLSAKTKSFSVRNIGDYTGIFIANVKCDGVPQSTSSAKSFTSGEIDEFRVTLNFAEKEDKNVDCNIVVFDSEDTSKRSTCVFNVDINKIEEGCKPEGVKICSADFKDVLKCTGGEYKVFQTCQFGCVTNDEGEVDCRSLSPEVCNNGIDDDGDGLTDDDDPDCQDDPIIPAWLKQIGFGALALLAGLVVFIVGRGLVTKFGGKAKEDKLTLVILGLISLMVAGLVYLIVIQYWIHILVIAGILLLIAFVIKVAIPG